MNFHDTRQFPTISPEAAKLLREVGVAPAAVGDRFEPGASKRFRNGFGASEERAFRATCKASTELVDAGYADTAGGSCTGGLTVKLTTKGAALSRYLSS